MRYLGVDMGVLKCYHEGTMRERERECYAQARCSYLNEDKISLGSWIVGGDGTAT